MSIHLPTEDKKLKSMSILLFEDEMAILAEHFRDDCEFKSWCIAKWDGEWPSALRGPWALEAQYERLSIAFNELSTWELMEHWDEYANDLAKEERKRCLK